MVKYKYKAFMLIFAKPCAVVTFDYVSEKSKETRQYLYAPTSLLWSMLGPCI